MTKALALTDEEVVMVLARRRARLRDEVARYLAEHPDASANEVARELRGRRTEILAAVKEITASAASEATGRFPAGGNHAPERGVA